MSQSTFDTRFRTARDRLRSLPQGETLEGFEREVWAEIAVRDRPALAGTPGWLWGVLGFRSRVATPAYALAAVVCGVVLALDRAEVYEAREAAALERSYVASIHPVMRSEPARAGTRLDP